MAVSELGVGCLLAALLVLTSVTLPDYAAISATVRAHVSFTSLVDFFVGNAAQFPGLLGVLAVFMKSKGLHIPVTVGVVGGVLAVVGDFLFALGVKVKSVWLLVWGRMVAEGGHLMAWYMAFPILTLAIYSSQQTSVIFTVVACERCFVPTLAYYWHYWLYAKLRHNLADTLLLNAVLRLFFPVLYTLCCWYVHALHVHREQAHDGVRPETTTAKKLRSICLRSVLTSQLVCPASYWLMMATMVVVAAMDGCFSELEVFSRVYNDSPAQVATEVAFGRGVAGVVCFVFAFLYMRRVHLEQRGRFNAQVLTFAMVLRLLGFVGVWLRMMQSHHGTIVLEQFWVEASLILGQILFDMWANQHLICLAGSGVAAAAGIALKFSLSSVVTLAMALAQSVVFNSLGIKWLTGLYALVFFFVVLFTIMVWLLTPSTYPGTLTAVPGIATFEEISDFPSAFQLTPRLSAPPGLRRTKHHHQLRLRRCVLHVLDRLCAPDQRRVDEDLDTLLQGCLTKSQPKPQSTWKANSAPAGSAPVCRKPHHHHHKAESQN